jgi:hypothetical protein
MMKVLNQRRKEKMKTVIRISLVTAAGLALGSCGSMPWESKSMGFFVTSTGSGNGAALGGLAGADKHCQSLAQTAGAGGRMWRAYLSTQGKDNAPTVNARDRIGKGPWHNAKGEQIAPDVDGLHGAGNKVTKETALNEKGQVVAGRGDKPANRHDILTGSRADGTAFAPADPDMTCANWTRSGAEGAVVVGHHDRQGPTADPWATSWNSSHQSRGGCSQTALQGTGGDGLFYCFAAN